MAARKLNKNWILAASEAFSPHSEAPEQFIIWTAISAVGAILKNRVWKKHGNFTIYPNKYVVLTGPPGIGKGEAIHPIYNMIKELDLANIISDRVTAPKIIERMASGFPPKVGMNSSGAVTITTDSTATLFSTELPTLVGSSDWMLQFLCDAWDRGEFYYDTKNCGNATIKGMCTSLIGGCVPEYIRRLNKDATAAINGGFTARTVFVYAENKSKSLPWPTSLDDTAKGRTTIQNLKDDLQTISQLSGEMVFNIEAQMKYVQFYKTIQIEDADSDVVLHFKRRYHIHVIKLAMIFCAAARDDRVVNSEDMILAIMCLRHVLANLDRAFRGVGESELAEATSKIQAYIEKKGLTSRSEILANMHRHVTTENLDRIISILLNIGFIVQETHGKAQKFRHVNKKTSYVVATQPMNIHTFSNGVKKP